METQTINRIENSLCQKWDATADSYAVVMSLRLIFSIAALIILCFYPLPAFFSRIVIIVLVFYTIYSAGSYVMFLKHGLRLPNALAAGIDITSALAMIALSHSVDSMFFGFLLFAILSAAFYGGQRLGLISTVIAAVLYTIVTAATSVTGSNFEMNHSVLRPICILVLGYLASLCGGGALMYRSHLVLLREVAMVSNPRFGLEHAIGEIMQRLSHLYGCNACMLLASGEGTDQYQVYRMDARHLKMESDVAPPCLTQRLMQFPDSLAMAYNRPLRFYQKSLAYVAIDVAAGCRSMEGQRQIIKEVKEIFDAESFMSVPIYKNKSRVGRIFLTSSSRQSFSLSDIDFLLQVFEYVVPMWDYIRLIERLSSHAAEDERKRIALDIHDYVIQPYIALQIGLDATMQNFITSTNGADGERCKNPDKTYSDIARLRDMTSAGVAEMRDYVTGLRQNSERGNSLLPAIRRYAHKISDTTGIAVSVNAHSEADVHGKLASEAFQIVCEGLSNIHRHTRSPYAEITISRLDGWLIISIRNEPHNIGGEAERSFTPRSITERAQALGGKAGVETEPGCDTVVTVSIPL